MQFAPYNKKGFLAPDSIHSMASYHAKIYESGEYRFRIHDCLTSIRLIGKLETEPDFEEAILKCDNLSKALYDFARYVDTLRCQLFPELKEKCKDKPICNYTTTCVLFPCNYYGCPKRNLQPETAITEPTLIRVKSTTFEDYERTNAPKIPQS